MHLVYISLRIRVVLPAPELALDHVHPVDFGQSLMSDFLPYVGAWKWCSTICEASLVKNSPNSMSIARDQPPPSQVFCLRSSAVRLEISPPKLGECLRTGTIHL